MIILLLACIYNNLLSNDIYTKKNTNWTNSYIVANLKGFQ